MHARSALPAPHRTGPTGRTRRSRLALTGLAAVMGAQALATMPVAAQTATPVADGILAPARQVEAVVLTGADLPTWSSRPATGQPATFPAGGNEDNPIGDQVRSAHHGTLVVPPDAGTGAPVERVTAWAWDAGAWREVPVQVDERFPYFLSNGRSGFGFYSGVDTELTYAWGGDGVHTVGEEAWKKVAGGTDAASDPGARYPADEAEVQALVDAGVITPGMGEELADYLAASADPVPGLDDDDEIAFMASDAGDLAGLDTNPPGVDPTSRQQVSLVDPLTGEASFVYLYLGETGSSFGPDTYVRHTRDANADWWADRGSWADTDPEKLGTSNTGYGPNLNGTVCTTKNPDGGTPILDDTCRPSSDRFPLDGMTVTTDSYEAYASGRWMFRSMRVAKPDGSGYGEDLVDRWKGRAFQQSPDSEVSLVGFEDEQVNWEANSAILGWRSGPVRTIREIWGADSGTNVTKTETFYRDAINHRYRVRVHPIPSDGLYTSWDYNRGIAACYFNAVTVTNDDLHTNPGDEACDGGVAVDGVDDENVGNIDGPQSLFGPSAPDYPFFFDAPDPTFDVPAALDRWEQVAGTGDNGSLVYLFELSGATTATNPLIVPYYRDDACLDDGTGDDPAPRPYPGERQDDARVYGDADAASCDPAALGTGALGVDPATRQGAHAAHGLHFFFTHDSDNAFVGTPAPVTEIDGAQWQWAVPMDAPTAVGEAYAQTVRAPLAATAVAQPVGPDGGPVGPGNGDATQLLAGAAKVDSTWHVGAGAGQYAGKQQGSMPDYHDGLGLDPHAHSTTAEASYGIQGREWVRALVLDDGSDRWAVVSNDLYIPQDVVNQRVAGILEEHDRQVELGLKQGPVVGITRDELTVSVSHSHSSPYYSSTTWGPWLFEDVFDLRYYEHIAQRMAEAVIEAAGSLEPAVLGGGETAFHHVKTHSYGPAIAENGPTEGTPAGYHQSDLDDNMTVVSIDGADDGQPIATWVVWGEHPEMDDGNDLLASEWWNTAERFVDREIGGVTLFSQRDTGSSETGKGADRYFDPQLRHEYADRHFAQIERAARLIADAVQHTRAAIADPTTPAPKDRLGRDLVNFDESTRVAPAPLADVEVAAEHFAPPGAQASPEVSNCNSANLYEYQVGVPVLGLPDCYILPTDQAVPAELRQAVDPRVTVAALKDAGIPVPDDYGFPSFTALEESAAAMIQAIRIGDIAVTVCPCEQFADQSRNIVTRLNREVADTWFGYDWTANPSFSPDLFQQGTAYLGGSSAPWSLQLPITDEQGYLGSAGRFWCEPWVNGAALAGYDGSDPLVTVPNLEPADLTWKCINPGAVGSPAKPSSGWGRLTAVSDHAFRLMKAQIYNDAAGWDQLDNSAEAESEPNDPAAVWGNFTHEELFGRTDGYRLVVPVGMSNDYFGYLVSYREYRAHDHYRKALTGLGPHSQDFMATRLTRLAADLRDAGSRTAETRTAKDDTYAAFDPPHRRALADAIGAGAAAFLPAYEATLPADGGEPIWLADPPAQVELFSAIEVPFIGGSNYTDNPVVTVQRLVDGVWTDHGGGEGETPIRVDFPLLEQPDDLLLYRLGQFPWRWTVNFEAFASDIPISNADGSTSYGTPPGTYRLVASGCHRGFVPQPALSSLTSTLPVAADPGGPCHSYDPLGRVQPYELPSKPFEVVPAGLPAPDVAADGDDVVVSFPDAGIDHRHVNTEPDVAWASGALVDFRDSYDSTFRFIDDSPEVRTYGLPQEDWERFCFRCSFRPWADAGVIESVPVTIERDGDTTTMAATYEGAGRYRLADVLTDGDQAYVAASDVTATSGLAGSVAATAADSARVGLAYVTIDGPAVVTEGEDPTASFTLTAHGAVDAPITVTVTPQALEDPASGFAATPGDDFDGTPSGQIVFEDAGASAVVTVPIVDDGDVEALEQFAVVVEASGDGFRPVTPAPFVVSIVSNDLPTLSHGAPATIDEDAGSFTITFEVDQVWPDGRPIVADLTVFADRRLVELDAYAVDVTGGTATVVAIIRDNPKWDGDREIRIVPTVRNGAATAPNDVVVIVRDDELPPPGQAKQL